MKDWIKRIVMSPRVHWVFVALFAGIAFYMAGVLATNAFNEKISPAGRIVLNVITLGNIAFDLVMINRTLKKMKKELTTDIEFEIMGVRRTEQDSFALFMQEHRLYPCRHCNEILESRVHLIVHALRDHDVSPNDTYQEILQQDAMEIQ